MMLYRQKILVALVLAVFAVALVVAWRLGPQFWARMWSARVEINRSTLPNARVYHASGGDVMIYLGESNDYNVYIVRASRNEVGVTGESYFWFVSSFGALAKGTRDPSINMLHEKFNYADPHLHLQKQSATFQTLGGQAVQVKW